MAYVALSRVRSLEGLHLTAFDPASIKVNVKCLKEINRLRQLHRKDLPAYKIPVATAKKRKLTGASEGDAALLPPPKKRKTAQVATKGGKKPPPNKTNAKATPDLITLGDGVAEDFKFHSVGVQWQRNACLLLSVTYEKANAVHAGGCDVSLMLPDKKHIKRIAGDNNCMFRSLSYVVTGSEDHHKAVRSKIVKHIKQCPSRILQHIKGNIDYGDCKTVSQYIKKSNMDKNGTWGSEVELLSFAHLTKTCVYSYSTGTARWNRYSPCDLDRRITSKVVAPAVYLYHQGDHYEVVLKTEANSKHVEGSKSNTYDKRMCKKQPDGKAIAKDKPSSKCDEPPPSDKPPQENRDPRSAKRKRVDSGSEKSPKHCKLSTPSSSQDHSPSDLRYNPVHEQWQRSKCASLNLRLMRNNRVYPGGPNVPLGPPDLTNVQRIWGDGNCLFRSFSHIITGSQDQYTALRTACIAHLRNFEFPHLVEDGITVIAHGGGTETVNSVEQYLRVTRMDKAGTYATDFEIRVMSHLLNTNVSVYEPVTGQWAVYTPFLLDPTLLHNIGAQSMYINNPRLHFEVVKLILPGSSL